MPLSTAREDLSIDQDATTRNRRSDSPVAVGAFRSGAGQTLVAVMVNVVCLLPAFLAISMPESISAELQIDPVVLGYAFSTFWLVASLAAYPLATLAGVWAPARSLRIAGLWNVLLCLALAVMSNSPGTFVALLAIAGLAPALAIPAMNMIISSVIPPNRRATAFAGASIGPVVALMLAGAIAPGVEDVLGWRPTFAACGLLTLFFVAMMKSDSRISGNQSEGPRQSRKSSKPSFRPLILMMAGVLAGNVGIGAATAYNIMAAPSAGVSGAFAQVVVFIGSVMSVVVRLGAAAIIDRRGSDPFAWCWLMLLLGAIGFVSLAIETPWGYALGLILVLGPGWSWMPLLVHGVIGRYPDAIAPASGIVQCVFFIGGVAGPSLMGFLVASNSFAFGWSMMVVAHAIGAISIIAANRRLPAFASWSGRTA